MASAIGGDLLVTVVHLVLAGIAEAVLVGVFAIQRRLDVAALTLEGVGAVVVAHGVILVIVGQFVATDHALAVHHGISAVKGCGALLATDGADTPVMTSAIGGDLLVTVTDLLPMGGVGDALRNRCGEGLYFGVAIIPAVELEVLVRRGIGSCGEFCTVLVRIRDGLRSLIELAMLASLEGHGVLGLSFDVHGILHFPVKPLCMAIIEGIRTLVERIIEVDCNNCSTSILGIDCYLQAVSIIPRAALPFADFNTFYIHDVRIA